MNEFMKWLHKDFGSKYTYRERRGGPYIFFGGVTLFN